MAINGQKAEAIYEKVIDILNKLEDRANRAKEEYTKIQTAINQLVTDYGPDIISMRDDTGTDDISVEYQAKALQAIQNYQALNSDCDNAISALSAITFGRGLIL